MINCPTKRKIRWLNIIGEYTCECIASIPRRSWKHQNIIEILSGLFITKGCLTHIRSDSGSKFIATALRNWLSNLNIATANIEPGSPWENGYCESFNAHMRDEFLNGEIFDTLTKSEILTRQWVNLYNTPDCTALTVIDLLFLSLFLGLLNLVCS